MSTKRIRIGLVGAGSMGHLHARVLSQAPRTDLAFVIDPNRGAAEELARRYETVVAPLDTDLRDVDAVVIASPTDTHAEWAHRAIEAGRPLLIEKPISEDLAEATAVIKATEAAGLPVMCGLLERFNPAIRTAFEIVEEPIHVTTMRHSQYLERISTGVVHDLVIHDVDIVLRLTGAQPSTVQGMFTRQHPHSVADDVAEVTLKFKDGLVASLSASRVSQRKVRMLTIAELTRLVEVDLLRQDLTVYRHVDADFLDGRGYRQQTAIEIPIIEHAQEPLVSQLERFVDLIDGRHDLDDERDSILPPHQVIQEAVNNGIG